MSKILKNSLIAELI